MKLYSNIEINRDHKDEVTPRVQSRTSNHKAWFRYPASLVRRFWEM